MNGPTYTREPARSRYRVSGVVFSMGPMRCCFVDLRSWSQYLLISRSVFTMQKGTESGDTSMDFTICFAGFVDGALLTVLF